MIGDPLDAPADMVPAIGRRTLVLVDGRTFAVSAESGQIEGGTHGLMHDDLRHLSRCVLEVEDASMSVLASSTPTPLSAVVVARLAAADEGPSAAVLTRRRWLADGLRDDIHVHNTTSRAQRWRLRLWLASDFAHIFDVKAGHSREPGEMTETSGGWLIAAPDESAASRIRVSTPPTSCDVNTGVLRWDLEVGGRSEQVVTVTVEPIIDNVPVTIAFPIGTTPADAVPLRRLASWRAAVPRVVSADHRWAPVVDQSLSDIAALRIIDAGHLDRPLVAAGAPWFMTLFGRDSLLTSWMTLPFDPSLAVGVLLALAELQGTRYDPVAEEQPGRILHELRRHGGGGPFASRSRYYGTVDATPLFVMLAAEARRWGALSDAELAALTPAIEAAVRWIVGDGDSNRDGFVDYERSDPSGLSNQGWKDSWDGISFADGTMPRGPIALAEVQGYAYAALLGAAELHTPGVDPIALRRQAADLRAAFNERFWDDQRGWFATGVDGSGRRIDSLTTNGGHALWTGIADPAIADRYLDRLMEDDVWTGWGLRTLATTMEAYDPLSYHNGSVWPHDTALCAAGAARYGRWDVVDRIVDGALDAALEFGGRPPELFAGISRSEAPMPVIYPASCSPQAWSSASVLLLLRSTLGLEPSLDGAGLQLTRSDLSTLHDLAIERLQFAGRRFDIEVRDGVASLRGKALRSA